MRKSNRLKQKKEKMGLFTEKLEPNHQQRKKVEEATGCAWKWERECAKKEEEKQFLAVNPFIRQG